MTRPAIILTLAIALLAACAAPGVNRSAANFNESKFTVDLNLCRGGNIAEASLRTIGKGAVGSLAGAGIVALHGAAAGSGEALVAGAIVGAVVGLGIGANDAVEEHNQEIADCLRQKGYEVVASALFVHPAEAVLRTDITLLGKWPEVLERRCVVFPVMCGSASPEVRLKGLRCDGLRQRYRKDQQGYDG